MKMTAKCISAVSKHSPTFTFLCFICTKDLLTCNTQECSLVQESKKKINDVTAAHLEIPQIVPPQYIPQIEASEAEHYNITDDYFGHLSNVAVRINENDEILETADISVINFLQTRQENTERGEEMGHVNATAKKSLCPVDKTAYQLNKSVFENGPDIIEENIASIAPNIYKKFNELHPDDSIAKPIKITNSVKPTYQPSVCDTRYVSNESELKTELKRQMKQNILKEKLPQLTKRTEMTNEEHSSSQSLKKLEKKPGPDETLQKCNKIEKMLLAVALSALKARRANATPVRPQVTVGSETLNDINLLMRLFQNRQSIHNSNIDDIMKLVSLLQNEITETHQTQEQPVTPAINESFPTIPSQELVQGVCGERIVEHFSCRHATPKALFKIKPIPERHGNFTVNQQKGITKYGNMKFLWTTLTPIYDMSSTKRKALLKEKKKKHEQANLQLYFTDQQTSKLVEVPKHKYLQNHRLNNTPVVDKTTDSINKFRVLPNIGIPTTDSRKTQTPATTS